MTAQENYKPFLVRRFDLAVQFASPGGWRIFNILRRLGVAYPLRFCFLQRVGEWRILDRPRRLLVASRFLVTITDFLERQYMLSFFPLNRLRFLATIYDVLGAPVGVLSVIKAYVVRLEEAGFIPASVYMPRQR